MSIMYKIVNFVLFAKNSIVVEVDEKFKVVFFSLRKNTDEMWLLERSHVLARCCVTSSHWNKSQFICTSPFQRGKD